MNQFQFYLAIVAAPIATMVTVLVGLIINNSLFNAHVKRLDEKIDTRYAQLNEKIDAKYEVHESHLRRVEDMLLGKFAELDNRLTRIEAQLNLH
jgi:xylose isomerase